MIRIALDRNYLYDGGGTEEVLSASDSVAPVLDIDYEGTKQTGQEFVVRQTGGGLISGDGTAVIEKIKGHTIAWNQLYNDSVPTTLSGRTYFLRENNGGTINKTISTSISFTNDSTERNCIDLTLLYWPNTLPANVSSFESDYLKWFGKKLGVEAYNAGTLLGSKMYGLRSKDVNDNVLSKINIDVTNLKGKLNGQGDEVVIFPYGANGLGSVCDEIDFVNKKAVKRIAVVDLGSLSWILRGAGTANERMYSKDINDYISSSFNGTYTSGFTCSRYKPSGSVNVYNHDYDKIIAIKKGDEYLSIYDSDYIGYTAKNFQTAMDGVMLYFVLATPEEYDIDSFQGITGRFITDDDGVAHKVKKVYLGTDLVFDNP